MNLPPTIRWMQQQWWYHIALAAAIAGGTVLWHCLETNGTVTADCLKTAATVAGSYLIGAFQHSPGSASFNADGTVAMPPPAKVIYKES